MISVGTGTGIGFQNAPIQSPPIVLPQFRPPTLITTPVISGSGAVGQQLSVTPALWDAHPAPIVSGQWLLDGAVLPGQTSLSYTPVAGQEAQVLTYREFADNGVGQDSADSNSVTVASANSAPTASDVTLEYDVIAA